MKATRRSAISNTLAAVAASTAWNPQTASAADNDESEQFFLRLLKSNCETAGQILKETPAGRQRTLRAAEKAAAARIGYPTCLF